MLTEGQNTKFINKPDGYLSCSLINSQSMEKQGESKQSRCNYDQSKEIMHMRKATLFV